MAWMVTDVIIEIELKLYPPFTQIWKLMGEFESYILSDPVEIATKAFVIKLSGI